MEKKKMKLWKKMLIVVLILLLIAIVFILRKVIILSNLDKKVTDYENNYDNIHSKTTINDMDYKTEIERFIKDDIDKIVSEKTDKNGNMTKIIQITYSTERKLYTESGDNKVAFVHKEDAIVRGSHLEDVPASYTTIMNFAYSINFPQKVLNALVTKINSVEVDGKECYELSSMNSPNFLYQENTTKMSVLIDKETGLPVKLVEEINENGMIRENVTTYEYKFNEVTDEDLKEPDISEYQIIEQN